MSNQDNFDSGGVFLIISTEIGINLGLGLANSRHMVAGMIYIFLYKVVHNCMY